VVQTCSQDSASAGLVFQGSWISSPLLDDREGSLAVLFCIWVERTFRMSSGVWTAYLDRGRCNEWLSLQVNNCRTCPLLLQEC